MTAKRTCPSCGVGLRVPAGAHGAALTCPRCLGKIEETPDGGSRPRRDGSVDAEVWWDTKGAGVGLIVLAVLGIVGLAFFLVSDSPFPRTGGEWSLVMLTGALFLAVLAAAVVEVRKPQDPAAQGVARMLGPGGRKEKQA
jgi:hypothetical protein